MPTYVVRQGDCFSSVANDHGFADWLPIYRHADNQELASNRPNPNILAPGDHIEIPEWETRQENAATDATHQFVRHVRTTHLRLELLDEEGEPLSGTRFRLLYGNETLDDETDENGLINVEIAPNLAAARLFVWLPEGTESASDAVTMDEWDHDDDGDNPDATGPNDAAEPAQAANADSEQNEEPPPIELELHLGYLDPIDTIAGVQARLRNLGFDPGPIDGINGPLTREAVRLFQIKKELAVDGIAGPNTQGELDSAHGC